MQEAGHCCSGVQGAWTPALSLGRVGVRLAALVRGRWGASAQVHSGHWVGWGTLQWGCCSAVRGAAWCCRPLPLLCSGSRKGEGRREGNGSHPSAHNSLSLSPSLPTQDPFNKSIPEFQGRVTGNQEDGVCAFFQANEVWRGVLNAGKLVPVGGAGEELGTGTLVAISSALFAEPHNSICPCRISVCSHLSSL